MPPTRYVWQQLAVLSAGLGALLLAGHVTRRMAESGAGTAFTPVELLVLATISVAAVGRAVYVIVTSAFSDAYRVFRARHLVFCGALLMAVAAGVAGAVLVRGPFANLLAYGRFTGEDVIDVATVVASVVCMLGAGVALTGAWDRTQVERNWYRTLLAVSRRGL